MNNVTAVTIISAGLFCGTYVCAYLPSLLRVNKDIITLISIFGTATILGACIIIVLPESAAILINAQYEINRLTGVQSGSEIDHDHELHMHDSLTTQDHYEGIVPESVMHTVGGTIMAGFMLMLILEESVSIFRDFYHTKKRNEFNLL